MLEKGGRKQPSGAVTPEEELKDPLILEFLGLKDEYSESDLEEALILRLGHFLLELGGAFAFIGRQRAGFASATRGTGSTSSSSIERFDASSSSTSSSTS